MRDDGRLAAGGVTEAHHPAESISPAPPRIVASDATGAANATAPRSATTADAPTISAPVPAELIILLNLRIVDSLSYACSSSASCARVESGEFGNPFPSSVPPFLSLFLFFFLTPRVSARRFCVTFASSSAAASSSSLSASACRQPRAHGLPGAAVIELVFAFPRRRWTLRRRNNRPDS